MTVQVFSERTAWEPAVPRETWERIARKALKDHGMDLDLVDLTVSLVGREAMRAYHRRFRGEDKDTDVMAFPAQTHDPETQHFYLGDILICFPVAEEQARQAGHDLAEELCLLFTHGLLPAADPALTSTIARSRQGSCGIGIRGFGPFGTPFGGLDGCFVRKSTPESTSRSPWRFSSWAGGWGFPPETGCPCSWPWGWFGWPRP